MINIIEISLIYGLAGIALYLNSKNEVLRLENKGLRDRIKRDNEWHEIDKKYSIDLARADERLKTSSEEFRKQFYKQCEEFHKQCEEFHKQCEEINKELELRNNE